MAEVFKKGVRIANREDTDQTASSENISDVFFFFFFFCCFRLTVWCLCVRVACVLEMA